MIRIRLAAVLLALSAVLSTHASLFIATLRGAHEVPPNSSGAGGGAILSLNLATGAWSLTGAISNFVASPTGAYLHGPAPAGQTAGDLFDLGFNYEPEGPLTGAGIFNDDEMTWLLNGLLYVNIPSAQYPDGEIRGQLVPVPEPGLWAAVAGLGLGVFAIFQRRQRQVSP